MSLKTKVLYISYDGMTDPLGQSQVIPYIEGLTNLGFEFHLLSCEKKERFKNGFAQINEKLTQANVFWHPLPYTSSPPIISTLKDIRRLNREAEKLNKEHQFQIVHCRSYIAAFIGLRLKTRKKIHFVFDMRGFWADERIDGKIWNIKNPVFHLIYKYFKRKEKQFLNHADQIVTLTQRAKTEIINNFGLKRKPEIDVIPCCVDNHLFSSDNVHSEQLEMYRDKLKISKNDFIISYSGSVGTWYMLEEMLDFFVVLQKAYPNARFLFITLDSPDTILNVSRQKNIADDKIIICSAKRTEMPILISLSTIALFFIKPAYSKMASSPTKMGELLSMGKPIITNSGVGDIDLLVEEDKIGIAINDLNEKGYLKAIDLIPSMLEKNREVFINVARMKYSLEFGVSTYNEIYCKLKKIPERDLS
jgi:glycosyltransferase involved in cell wall biosynthesis